jgi:hypothetical protein
VVLAQRLGKQEVQQGGAWQVWVQRTDSKGGEGARNRLNNTAAPIIRVYNISKGQGFCTSNSSSCADCLRPPGAASSLQPNH